MISHYEVKAPLRFDADGKPFAIGLDGDKERTPFCWRYKDCQCVGWEDDDGTREQAEKEANELRITSG